MSYTPSKTITKNIQRQINALKLVFVVIWLILIWQVAVGFALMRDSHEHDAPVVEVVEDE